MSPVEPVSQRRGAWQPEAQAVEMSFEEVAALARRTLVDGDARGLVEHQHERIAVEQALAQVFRRGDAMIIHA